MVMVAAAMTMGGCATSKKAAATTTSTEEKTAAADTRTNVSRTDTVLQHDTTYVRQSSRTEVTPREVTAKIPLPQVQVERETSDTTSIIETPYFFSKATWSHGKLRHTLISKQGASVEGKVQVTDTNTEVRTDTKTASEKKTASTRDTASVASTNTTTTKETNQVKEKPVSPWKTVKKVAEVIGWTSIAAVLLYFILRAADFFKRRS